MRSYLSLLFVLIWIVGCKPENLEELGNNLNNTNAAKLRGIDTKILEGEVGSFSNILVVDSLIILHHNVPNPFYYTVYNRLTGNYLRSFGRSGSGPGEIADYNTFSKGGEDGYFHVLVPNQKGKVLRYYLPDLLKNEDYLPEVLIELGYDIDGFAVSGDTFWSLSLFSEKRLLETSLDSKPTTSYLDYPFALQFEQFNAELLGMAFQGILVLHPSESFGAIFTYASPNIDIFNFSDSLRLMASHHIRSPEVFDESEMLSEDTYSSAISYSSKNEMAFLSICATSKYIYALYSGRSHEKFKSRKNYGNLILIFDWQGKLVSKLELDVDTDQIAIGPENKVLYTLIEEESENLILSYSVPELN